MNGAIGPVVLYIKLISILMSYARHNINEGYRVDNLLLRKALFLFLEPGLRLQPQALACGQEINRVQNGNPGYLLLRPEVELLDTFDNL